MGRNDSPRFGISLVGSPYLMREVSASGASSDPSSASPRKKQPDPKDRGLLVWTVPSTLWESQIPSVLRSGTPKIRPKNHSSHLIHRPREKGHAGNQAEPTSVPRTDRHGVAADRAARGAGPGRPDVPYL